MATIIFNGKTYNTTDEMSAADRAAFEQLAGMFVDKNGNGIPDFLEGDIIKNVSTAYANLATINAQTYNNMNEMPEDMRIKVQEAFQKMSELGLVNTLPASSAVQMSSDSLFQESQFHSRPFTTGQDQSAIQEGNRPSTIQWILLGLIIVFCAMAVTAGAVYFYLR